MERKAGIRNGGWREKGKVQDRGREKRREAPHGGVQVLPPGASAGGGGVIDHSPYFQVFPYQLCTHDHSMPACPLP